MLGYVHKLFLVLTLAGLTTLLAGCTVSERSGGLNVDAFGELASQPLNCQPWNFGQLPGTLITTDHYHLYTTIHDPLYQRLIARILESCYAHFTELNPQTSVANPMDCYVFADRDSWELYTKLRAGSNAPIYLQISAGGYCQEGIFAGYDIGREQTLSVLAHEAWHQFSWYAFKDRLPSWLEEGLATQNEAIVWDGVTPSFSPEMNYRRFQALQAAQREHRLWSPARFAGHARRPRHQDAAEIYRCLLCPTLDPGSVFGTQPLPHPPGRNSARRSRRYAGEHLGQ